jgi:hypothetical protein
MADGTTKPISAVHDGDQVLATDPTTGDTKPEKVTDTITGQGTKNLVELTVAAAGAATSVGAPDGGKASPIGTLVATDNHPFWVVNAHEWRNAADLKPGDLLRTSAGTYVQITAVKRWTATDQRVRNLTVDTLHTFYVMAGDTPVLVHNGDSCLPAGGLHMSGGGPNGGTPFGRPTFREGSEYNLDDAGLVIPQTGQVGSKGISTFGDPASSGRSGNWWGAEGGTPLPHGIGIVADGGAVVDNATIPPTHHTLYPTEPMLPDDFLARVLSLNFTNYWGKTK